MQQLGIGQVEESKEEKSGGWELEMNFVRETERCQRGNLTHFAHCTIQIIFPFDLLETLLLTDTAEVGRFMCVLVSQGLGLALK